MIIELTDKKIKMCQRALVRYGAYCADMARHMAANGAKDQRGNPYPIGAFNEAQDEQGKAYTLASRLQELSTKEP